MAVSPSNNKHDKACPFCGHSDFLQERLITTTAARIECIFCGTLGPMAEATQDHTGVDNAWDYWNERRDTPEEE